MAMALVRPLGVAAAIAAAAILISYATGFAPGYRPWPTTAGTAPMTGIMLLLLGIGVAGHGVWRNSRFEIAVVSGALVIALLRMMETGFDFSVLPWTVVRPDPQAAPIVFGWSSALGGALCAITILVMRHVRPLAGQFVAGLCLAVPEVTLVGYSYQLPSFYGRSSVYVAIILLVLGSATALATARGGIMHILLGPFVVGRLARFQLACAFLIPYAIGLILLRAGAYHAVPVIGIGVIGTAGATAILMCISLVALERMDGQRRRAERTAYYDATHDQLTGLANRRMFVDIAQRDMMRAARQKTPASLIMIDIDLFKSVNDRFGHAAGDQVLRRTAQLLLKNLRAGDLAARIGGEEFAIFLPATPADAARTLAERLRAAQASADFSAAIGVREPVTLSAGVALQTAQSGGLDAMLKAADDALYVAKGKGRNRVELAAVTDAPQPA